MPELEIAARHDLTIEEKALLLGRTVYAVNTAAYKVRRDAQLTELVGPPREPCDSRGLDLRQRRPLESPRLSGGH